MMLRVIWLCTIWWAGGVVSYMAFDSWYERQQIEQAKVCGHPTPIPKISP